MKSPEMTLRWGRALTALMVVGAIAGNWAGPTTAAPHLANSVAALQEPVTVILWESDGSGVSGEAVLSPDGDQTIVSITLALASSSPAPPYGAHLHLGSCNQEQLPLIADLGEVHGNDPSQTTVSASLDELLSGEYLINIHRDPENRERDLACGQIRPPYCDDLTTGLALVAAARLVAYRQPNGCENLLDVDSPRDAGVGDTIVIGESGRALLTFFDDLRIEIFRGSQVELDWNADIAPDPSAANVFALATGTPLDVKAQARVNFTTPNATIVNFGTRFFVYAGLFESQDVTWVIVQEGEVDVEADGQTVTVRAGEQTWVLGDQAPDSPRPATREEIELRFPTGSFPSIEEITGQEQLDGFYLDADTTAPSIPSGVRISPETGDLTWGAATDDVGVVNYEIRLVDGQSIDVVSGTETSYPPSLCSSENPDADPIVVVVAIDAAGNRSAPSEPFLYHCVS